MSCGVHFKSRHRRSIYFMSNRATLLFLILDAKLLENSFLLRKLNGLPIPRALNMRSKLYLIMSQSIWFVNLSKYFLYLGNYSL